METTLNSSTSSSYPEDRRRDVQDGSDDDAVQKVVNRAPKLTPAQRDTLATIFRPVPAPKGRRRKTRSATDWDKLARATHADEFGDGRD
ncbi:hypothetical protein [Pseudonocardia sp. T1-2H]|uniref:hypothetical protein n=1 Tax=Pseudonocardia sp. T1-2H TaxID=3128899 RepID=UPI00310119BB